MAQHPKIRVVTTPQSIGTKVFIDDKEIHGLRAVEIRAGVEELSIVTLIFLASELEVTGFVDSVSRVREG